MQTWRKISGKTKCRTSVGCRRKLGFMKMADECDGSFLSRTKFLSLLADLPLRQSCASPKRNLGGRRWMTSVHLSSSPPYQLNADKPALQPLSSSNWLIDLPGCFYDTAHSVHWIYRRQLEQAHVGSFHKPHLWTHDTRTLPADEKVPRKKTEMLTEKIQI